jgi:hypothetical protein
VAGKLRHHVRSRVSETTMPDDRGGGSSEGMGGSYASEARGGQVKRVERAGAAIASEHGTRGEVAYGEPPGIELHQTVVVTSEATK